MDGSTAVVTGASRGVGNAVVRAFAARGARVVCCARADSGLEDAVGDVDGAEPVVADVRDEFDLERLMELAARAGDDAGIDVVVAAAAVAHGDPGASPLDETAYSAFDDTLRTNVRGVFATVREALPHLAADGRVLVPSAAVAADPDPGSGAYAVSKAGAEAVARGFAADVEQAVGVVDPGAVATDLTGDDGRDPDDVADMFVWAAEEVAADRLDGRRLDVKTWVKETR